MNEIKLLMKYVKDHRLVVFAFLFSLFIFSLVFSMYDLPLESIAYAGLLCVFFGIIFTAIDFRRYRKKHLMLQTLSFQNSLEIESISDIRSLIEEDYQGLIKNLYNENKRIRSESEFAQTELMDVTTLWAHQIKTPISAMRLLMQSGEYTEHEELSYELFEIEQYVEMVLGYFRINSESTDFILKRYDLDSIVRQAIRKYAKTFIRKKISLTMGKIEMNPLTDEKWLVFVLEQILSNALKYTNEGSISIYTENNQILVIEDTGIGIQEEDLPRVFEKGFTGYNGRSDKKSTGIGLYLCKKILYKLGHEISIESKIGSGTRIRINLSSVTLTVE